MKRRIVLLASVVVAGAGVLVLLLQGSATVVPRQVTLIVTGAEGQQFAGSYVSDGVTNTLSAVVPATVRIRAREVIYEFLTDDDRGEFRVALEVDDVNRTSFVSHQGRTVRGGWRYSEVGESVW